MRHAFAPRSSSSDSSQASVGAVVRYLYVVRPGMGVWACARVFRCGVSDAMDSKTRFRLTFSTGRSSRIAQSRTLSRKTVGGTIWASVEKGRSRLTDPTV